MEKVLADSDIEVTKLLLVVGVINSMDPARRVRIMKYLIDRYGIE